MNIVYRFQRNRYMFAKSKRKKIVNDSCQYWLSLCLIWCISQAYEENFNFEYDLELRTHVWACVCVCAYVNKTISLSCGANTISERELKLITDEHFIHKNHFFCFRSFFLIRSFVSEYFYLELFIFYMRTQNGNLLLISLFPSSKIIISIKSIIHLYGHLFICTRM